jgi:tetratricopeptide (TPR) repeat protein
MSRFCLSFGAVAVSALLCSGALASPPEHATMAQNIDAGVREAQLKRSANDYTGAIKVLSQLMLVAADDPRVVGEYGKVLVQQGRAPEALDFLNRAVQLQTNDWTLYSALGIAYDQKGDYTSSQAAYQRALQLKPGEGAVLNNFAMSRLLAGDLDRAKSLIAEAAANSKDERIAKNVSMIASLKAPAPAPVAAAGPKSATGAPRVLARPITPAEGNRVVMQAVPKDPDAGPVAKKVKKTAAAAKPKDAIPALRLSGGGQ